MKYNNLATAIRFSWRTIKPSTVILGDDGLFWVVSLADAARLIAQGYQLA